MKAMILAAGLGTRLQPYSLVRPKPLFPILNTPLLLHTLQRLKLAGFHDVAINCHHLAPQIRECVSDIEGVQLFYEDDVLGTGGGLKNAVTWFDGDPVLVTNGDIYHNLDFRKIMDHHLQHKNIATLVCHSYPRFNKVSLGKEDEIMQFSPCSEAQRLVAFTGVHVLEPHILSVVSPGFSSILDCYNAWIKNGAQVQSMMVRGHFWLDMGTPADYLELHRVLLTRQESPFLVHPSVEVKDVVFKDWVSVGENAVLGKGCHLERVVVWDGATVAPGACLKDTITT